MSHVFPRLKAWSFNKEAAKRALLVLDALKVEEGQTVADIGSGGGYFVVQFAKAVGSNGKVYAVDTDAKLLDALEAYAGKQGALNVEPVHVPDGGVPSLPEGSVDLIFSRDSYHHIEMPHVEYFSSFKRLLKEGGRVVIIDYKPEKLHRIFGHATGPVVIQRELAEAGYELIASHDFLPEQSFFVFKPK